MPLSKLLQLEWDSIKASTVKTENCAVVLLCVLMDDTPTIDVMWIFCVFSIYVYFCVQKMQVCEFFIVVR